MLRPRAVSGVISNQRQKVSLVSTIAPSDWRVIKMPLGLDKKARNIFPESRNASARLLSVMSISMPSHTTRPSASWRGRRTQMHQRTCPSLRRTRTTSLKTLISAKTAPLPQTDGLVLLGDLHIQHLRIPHDRFRRHTHESAPHPR